MPYRNIQWTLFTGVGDVHTYNIVVQNTSLCIYHGSGDIYASSAKFSILTIFNNYYNSETIFADIKIEIILLVLHVT